MANNIEKSKPTKKIRNFFKKTWIYIVSFIVSIAVITLIFVYQVDFSHLKETFKEANYWFVALAVLFYIIGLIIGALKIQYLLKINNFKLNFGKSLLYHLFGMLFANFTPAKSGYTLISYPLKENGFPVSKSVSTFFVGQLYDFTLRIPIAIIGVIFLFVNTNSTDSLWLGLIGLVMLLLLAIASYVFASGRLFNIEKLFTKRLVKVGNFIRRYKEQFQKISLKQSIIITLYTLLGWIAFALKWYFISYSINFKMSFIDSAFLLPLIFIISFLPISLAGLGFVEGGVIFLYQFRFPTIDKDLIGSIGISFMIIERCINLIASLPGLLTYAELYRNRIRKDDLVADQSKEGIIELTDKNANEIEIADTNEK